LLSKTGFAIPVVFLCLAGSKFRQLPFTYSCSPIVHIPYPVLVKQLESSMFHPSLPVHWSVDTNVNGLKSLLRTAFVERHEKFLQNSTAGLLLVSVKTYISATTKSGKLDISW